MRLPRAVSVACAIATWSLTTPGAAAQETAAASSPAERTWEINARDQDIRQFITQVSQITGRPFVIDPRVKGTVTVVSSTELDRDAVYELLLSVLRVHGFGAYAVGEVVHVVQNPTLVKQTGGGDDGLSQARQAMVTQVIAAQNVAAAELVKILRPIIPQYGHIAAVAKPNVVILSDHADNIERLMRIVAEIDVANEEEFVVRPLTFAWVGSVVTILEKVAPDQLGESGPGPQVVQVIANERNNSLILRGKSRPVAVIMDLVDKLDIPATSTDAAQVIRLAHAQAAKVVEILNGLFTVADESEQGQHISIQPDESLNAIVARADPGTMGEILDVIRMLDVRRTQVLIEAAIAEVAVDDLFTLGIETAGTDQRGQSVPAFNTTLNGIVNALLAGARSDDSSAVDGVGVVTSTTTPGIAVAKVDPDGISFGAVLNALATNVAADLLSAPSVLTLDNEEAKNLVGQNVPFRSGSFTTTADGISNPFSTVQRQDIGITLTVTPHIHDGTSVRLEVLLTVENLVDSGLGASGGGLEAADIITQKREIETTVLADDNQTIVLGGLIQDDIRESRRKVPLLGDVPALGRLFRSNRETRAKRNLLVFLRPTVLRSEGDVRVTTDRLYNRIREFQIESRPEGATRSTDDIYEGRGNG